MQRFNIYLAGGVTGLPAHGENGYMTWRREVKDQIKSGIYDSIFDVVVVDPTEYFNFEEKKYQTEREIMEFDLYKVRTSDLIIASFSAPRSLGTMAELAIAYERRIPIIGLCERESNNDMHPWQHEFCTRIFSRRDEMLDYIRNYYLN